MTNALAVLPSQPESILGLLPSLQQGMPLPLFNSVRWGELASAARAISPSHDDKLLPIILHWMWDTVLPLLQNRAEALGFGTEWKEMCQNRTYGSACNAGVTARERTFSQPSRSRESFFCDGARWVAFTAGRTVACASLIKDPTNKKYREVVMGEVVLSKEEGITFARSACGYAGNVATLVGRCGELDPDTARWAAIDPCGLLRRLIDASCDKTPLLLS